MPLGASTLEVEVTNVSKHGFWLLLGDEELFVPCSDFPWFKEAPIAKILHVERPQLEPCVDATVGRRRIVSWRGDVRSHRGCPSCTPAGLRTSTSVDERACARPARLGDGGGVYRSSDWRIRSPGGNRYVGSLARLQVLDACRSSILPGSRSVSFGRYLGDSYRSHLDCLRAVGRKYVSVSGKRRSRRGCGAASGFMVVSRGRGGKRRSRSFRFANGHRSAACR